MITSHDLYRREQQSLLDQLSALSDAQAASSVPSCPGWTVTDVVAHLSGLVAETLANVPLPRGSDEATARQVRDRGGLSLDQICLEWSNNAAAFEAFAEQDPNYVGALTSDLVVHSHDIAEALGLPIDETSPAVRWVATRYLGVLQTRAVERLGRLVHVVFSDTGIDVRGADGSQGLTLTTTAFAFLRSVTGRRSRREIEGLDWSGDPAELLDNAWDQYGPMPD